MCLLCGQSLVALLVLVAQCCPLLGNGTLLGEDVVITIYRARILIVGIVVGLILRLLASLSRLLRLLAGKLGLLLSCAHEGCAQRYQGGDNQTYRSSHRSKGSFDKREHSEELTTHRKDWSDCRCKRCDDNDYLLRCRTQVLKPGYHVGYPTDNLLQGRHQYHSELLGKVAQLVFELSHTTRSRLRCCLSIALVVFEDVLDRLATLELLGSEALQSRDALAQLSRKTSVGLRQILHCRFECHSRCHRELCRSLDDIVNLPFGHAQRCEVGLLCYNLLISEGGARLQLCRLRHQPALDILTPFKRSEQACFSLHLRICRHNRCSAESYEWQRERLGERLTYGGHLLLKTLQRLLHLLRALLKLVAVSTNFNE